MQRMFKNSRYRHATVSGNNEDSVSRELMPADFKEKLIRLEHENKILRQNQGSSGDHTSVQVFK